MPIAAEAVRELAQLAQLELSPAEVERMRRDLDEILRYVEKVNELDTTDVPPTTHVLELATPLRNDGPTSALPVEDALRNAPERRAGAMVVPRVIE